MFTKSTLKEKQISRNNVQLLNIPCRGKLPRQGKFSFFLDEVSPDKVLNTEATITGVR